MALSIPSQTRQYASTSPVDIPDESTRTSLILVSGADAVLLDVNLRAFLRHPFPSDLGITVTSPSGTVVLLASTRGGNVVNVFNGTLWDDDADPLGQVPYTSNNLLVSDAFFMLNSPPAPALVPEGALGAFIGENPNGVWTITIADNAELDSGTLDSWSLDLTGASALPPAAAAEFSNTTPLAIPSGPAVVTSQIVVSGAGPNLFDLDLQTFLRHEFPLNLDVTLTSPAGTVVTIITDQGFFNDDIFNGTVWDDDAALAVADNPNIVSGTAPALIPEEAMAAFAGEDPNGVWTLTISDDSAGDAGSLDSWSLFVNSTAAIPVVTGTPGPDPFAAGAGHSRIDGLGGIDTATFDFRLVDATIAFIGNRVIVTGPSGHTELTGIERYVFSDGTVDNADGSPLVDDLFYYARYHDAWAAHLDADAHYNTAGWREGRDPSAFFSTSFYLAQNADVRAAGVNPLQHYDASGWREGRSPSAAFDPAHYLSAAVNPDVLAAGVAPLRHYFEYGYQEGRVPLGPDRLLAPDGFDYVYYLAVNPDVAAAGVDPLRHFQTAGWKEGRDPNIYFDVTGYLAAYADVAAAGANPFDHYNQVGWQEGRDPSVHFDTAAYLAAYADVAAAGVNPLLHFLHFGIAEGRSAFGDGAFG
jgi:subtilisin-like proprotein convertase family protein